VPIINSTYIVDETPQADGRRWVKETHTDHNGIKHFAEYLASDGFDYETCLAARAETIGGDLDRKEAALNEGRTGVNYRRIRPACFMDRFDALTEQIKIEVSTDPLIKVFEKNAILVERPYIDLDHPLIVGAMPYLRDNGILDGATPEERQARMEYLLRDGDITEI